MIDIDNPELYLSLEDKIKSEPEPTKICVRCGKNATLKHMFTLNILDPTLDLALYTCDHSYCHDYAMTCAARQGRSGRRSVIRLQ